MKLKKICLACAAALSFSAESLSATGLVCRSPGVAGWEIENVRAKEIVGSNTTRLSDMRVYITARAGYLYIQSNFVVDSYDQPTKILVDDLLDLETLVQNLACDQAFCVPKEELGRAIASEIWFGIDKQALREEGFGKLDFSKAGLVCELPSPKKAATVPPVPPVIDPASPGTSELVRESHEPPDSLNAAAVAMLWGSVGGRVLLGLAAVGAMMFAMWISLPERLKYQLALRMARGAKLMRRRERGGTTSASTAPNPAPPADG